VSIKKRVLVLTSTFPRWQGDNEPPFVFELCQRLGEQFDVVVLAPHAEGAKRFERMGNIETLRFRYFFPRWEKLAYQGGILANLKRRRWCYLLLPFYFLAQLAALWRILRHERIDVIHAHWLIPQGLTVAIAGVFTRNMPPMICTSHGGDLLGLNGLLLDSIKRRVIRSSSMLTVVSHAMEERALSLGAKAEKLQTVSMGVETGSLFTPDTATLRADNEILFVGRLVEKKGCTYLLDAMPEILRRRPDARLGIVGSGPEEETLKRQADRLGVAHAVTFHGAVINAEIPNLYRRATVFVAPSIVTAQGDQEGLGLVLVEALGCGCTVVASDLPAIRDVVSDGVTGLLCKQRDSLDIATKVCTLLEHTELRLSLGRAGRQHVQERFDWSAISRRYALLIDGLIRDRS
jgi:glycosyltransferase involved in cell wall biosynthesis